MVVLLYKFFVQVVLKLFLGCVLQDIYNTQTFKWTICIKLSEIKQVQCQMFMHIY